MKLLVLALVALVAVLLQPSGGGPASASRTSGGGQSLAAPSTNGTFQGLMGDVDCNVNVNSVDALKILRFVAQLSVAQTEPCPDINTAVTGLDFAWGDVDCNEVVNSVDSLKVLRFVAELSVSQVEPCTNVGEPVTPLEGFGDLTGTVVNATNADPLPGATVNLRERAPAFSGSAEGCTGPVMETDTTDSNGEFGFIEVPAGYYDIEVMLEDFLESCLVNILVLGDTTTVRTISLSPPLGTGELRIVLSWGAVPDDLDSHLWLPEEFGYEIYFVDEGTLTECPFAQLDVDDTSSFGPETITIAQRFNGTYRYAVHNWSEDISSETGPLRQSGAQVQVFGEAGLVAAYQVPASGDGYWWHVFDMDGQTGNITTVNQIGDDPSPYVIGNGCP